MLLSFGGSGGASNVFRHLQVSKRRALADRRRAHRVAFRSIIVAAVSGAGILAVSSIAHAADSQSEWPQVCRDAQQSPDKGEYGTAAHSMMMGCTLAYTTCAFSRDALVAAGSERASIIARCMESAVAGPSARSGGAGAPQSSNMKECEDKSGGEASIRACTAVIESRGETEQSVFEARLFRASWSVGAQKWDVAISDCTIVLKENPELTLCYLFRAEAEEMGTHDFVAAIDDAGRAIAHHIDADELPNAYLLRADAYWFRARPENDTNPDAALTDYSHVIGDYRSFMKLAPHEAGKNVWMLIDSLTRRGNLEKAKGMLAQANADLAEANELHAEYGQ